MHQEGKLNPEQFALAMWLIKRKQNGRDPPASLTPDMVPPSLRPKGQDAVKNHSNSIYCGRGQGPPLIAFGKMHSK